MVNIQNIRDKISPFMNDNVMVEMLNSIIKNISDEFNTEVPSQMISFLSKMNFNSDDGIIGFSPINVFNFHTNTDEIRIEFELENNENFYLWVETNKICASLPLEVS